MMIDMFIGGINSDRDDDEYGVSDRDGDASDSDSDRFWHRGDMRGAIVVVLLVLEGRLRSG